MDNMKLIAQLLRGIRDREMGKKFNGLDLLPKYKNESGDTIIPTEELRWLSALALKLQKAGYVAGFLVDEYSGVCWQCSEPTLTLAGIEYMETNPFVKRWLQDGH